MTENVTYYDKHVSSRKCIFSVVHASSERQWCWCRSPPWSNPPPTGWWKRPQDGIPREQKVSAVEKCFCGCFWRFGNICEYIGGRTSTTKKYTFVMIRVCHSRSLFCHACTSMTNLWQNQDSHTCAVVEVFHDITRIIITEVSTSMTINRASWKCFRQGWPTRGIHRSGLPLSYRDRFWI